MSNPPLRLHEMEIAAFRGVRGAPEPFRLDLSARLTVLLAANGTGKTSICQAAEWLITGEVRDHSDGDLAFVGRSDELLVSGKASIASETARFRYGLGRRELKLSNRILKSNADIRRFLAPDAVEQDGGAHASNARRDWLRGTRFLSVSDIGVLLDPDPDQQDARRKIYADLFGIQHLEQADRRLTQYMDPLRSAYRAQQRHADGIAAALADLPGGDGIAGEDGARQQLSEAAMLLDIKLAGDDQLFELAADAVRAALLAAEKRLADQWEALNHLKSLERPLDVLEADQQEAQLFLSAATREAADSAARRDNVKRRLADLRERAEDIRVQRNVLIEAWDDAILHAPSVRDVASEETLRAVFPEIEWSEERRVSRLEKLRQFQRGQSKYDQEADRLAALVAQHSEVPAPSKAEVEQAEQAVAHAEAVLAGTVAAGTDAKGALVDLKQAGEALLRSATDSDADCPLCGHDWVSVHALRKAISRTLDALPPALQRLAAERTQAEEMLADCRSRLSLLNKRRAAAEEIDRLRSSLSHRRSEAETLGLTEPWHASAEAQRSRLQAARPLARLIAALTDAERALERDRRGLPLAERHASILTEPSATQLDKAVETAISDCRKATETASTAVAEEARLKDVYTAVVTRLEQARSAQRLLFDGDETGDLQAARVRLAARSDRLSAARNALEIADAIQAQSRLAEERSRLVAARADAEQRCGALYNKLETADRARSKIKAHRDDFMDRQMRALLPQVRSLFARVHANRVFDSIQTGEDPLSWFGDLEGHSLSARDFSAGQRQDLALALFLARACSLRGTFFLDEPLVHLDDLNRVAVLDILRMIALTHPDVHLVLTTASRPLAHHIKEKFGRIKNWRGVPREDLVKVLELRGSPATDLATSDL